MLVTIKEGTFIYRLDESEEILKNIYQYPRKCTDTYKCGIYFSTYPMMALMMATERIHYDTPTIGVYKLNYNLVCVYGKYEHEQNKLKFMHPNNVMNYTNTSHYDDLVLPITYNEQHIMQTYPNLKDDDYAILGGELFISSDDMTDDLITLMETHKVNRTELFKQLELQNYDEFYDYYNTQNILYDHKYY